MNEAKLLRIYYSTHYHTIFRSIPDINQRVFRTKTKSGKFTRLHKHIARNKPTDLKRYLTKYTNDKVYTSVARWYNPVKHYGKRTKRSCNKIADSILLDMDLFFDIDHEDLRYALHDIRQVMEYMDTEQKKEYELRTIQFSGEKGFHILYTQNNKVNEPDPMKRITEYQNQRKKLVEHMLTYFQDKGQKMYTLDENHINIITDPYRVYAAPYTVKSRSGYVVYPLKKEQVMTMTAEEIMKTIPNIYSPGRGSASMTHVGSKEKVSSGSIKNGITPLNPTFRHHEQGNERSGLSSYPTTYSYFDNIVYGTKGLYVPVLKYKRGYPVKRLMRAQEKYNLTSFYIIKSEKVYYAICLKTVDYTRLIKIMKYTKAKNLSNFLYRKHAWIVISEKKKADIALEEAPTYHETITSTHNCKGTISLPHQRLLEIVFNTPVTETLMAIGSGGAIGTAYVTEEKNIIEGTT